MLTRCPHCATSFRVSPQQLKVHHGEVRCGRCTTVFDAFDSLVAEPAPAVAAAVQELAHDQHDAVAATPMPEEFFSDPGTARAAAAVIDEPRERPHMPPGAPGDLMANGLEMTPASGPFSRNAKRAPGRRWPWAVLGVAAAIALLGQAAFLYRSELAALLPEARPWLERACAELRCTVVLPRHVELVSIDASDLQLDTTRANLMLLTATLKNRAPFPQEHPALALTLTDTADQPLARRVLAPADYLERKPDGKSGFPANAEIAVKVFIDSREVKAAGYRLFLFYP